MLPPDKLTSGSTTVVLAFELDSNSFNLGTNPSIVIQPDLTGSLLTGNQNSLVSTRRICCSIDWTKPCSTMTLGKPLVPSLRWGGPGISLYKFVCLIFICRQCKFIFTKSLILGMEPVTTGTQTSQMFSVTLVVRVLYDLNLPVEILRVKSQAKVLYAVTCEKHCKVWYILSPGTILLVAKKSNNGLMLHLYSPLPMGKSQNDMYRKYVLESNLNL